MTKWTVKLYKRVNGKVVRVRPPRQDSRFEPKQEVEVDYPSETYLGSGEIKYRFGIRKAGA